MDTLTARRSTPRTTLNRRRTHARADWLIEWGVTAAFRRLSAVAGFDAAHQAFESAALNVDYTWPDKVELAERVADQTIDLVLDGRRKMA